MPVKNQNDLDTLEQLNLFLIYLEKNKIIDVREVLSDKKQLDALIQDILQLDIAKFN